MLTKLRKWFNVGVLSNNQLKMIALVCMTIDHIGAYILTDWIILRIIGRIAFPIFAYMIAEGCAYTKNRKKYLGVMAVTAVLYQGAYFVLTKSLAQCILVTFTLSILLIYITDYAKTKRTPKACSLALVSFITVFIIVEIVPRLLDTTFSVDYGFVGILVPVLVYVVEAWQDKLFMFSMSLFVLAGILGGVQWFSLLAIPLLAVYNERRGKRRLKYFFYAYYPLHLAVIYFIGLLLEKI
ncbi:MAG: hypothetical protein E7401_06210 [Ruminococcaceae bacterium]|nr:hypothetical protein [Oscillospiraceae bacterium]